MRISVALCSFNGEQFLQEQLSSIAVQSVRPNELIVCDDHSSDSSLEIINSFKSASPFPVSVFQNSCTLGSSKNFERAVRLCSGDIIAFADQDDVWEPEKLEALSSAFMKDPTIGYAFSDAELVDAELKTLGIGLWEAVGFTRKDYQSYLQGEQFEVLVRRNVVSGTTMAISASIKELVLPFSQNWIHDGWIALLASIVDIKGTPIPDQLVKYRQHSRQQLGERKKNMSDAIGNSLATRADDFGKLASACHDARERILGRCERLDRFQRNRLDLLERKEAHFLRRQVIHSSSGLERLRHIADEIRLGNYRLFSRGWMSVGRDLLW